MIQFLFALFIVFGLLEAAEPVPEKKRVCLNMIVKNESHVITRCLSSVTPIIDSWVIVDTGSTDGTQKIIKDYMKDIPGELYERPWVNFEHNREEALQLAKNSKIAKADYILFIDADDYFTYADNFQLPPLTADSYNVVSHSHGTDYYLPRVIKANLDWHWYGVLHEYVQAPDTKTSVKLLGIENIYTSEGSRSKDPEKYRKDVRILEEALKKEPDNKRYRFYLAQSYLAAGDLEKAIENYEIRAKIGGWYEEVYWSLLQVARLQDRLHQDAKKVEQSYLKAYQYRPVRIEPFYYLAMKFRQEGNFRKGYEISKLALDKPIPNDTLFVEKWIYDYGMLFEYSISAYWIGEYEECKNACDRILAMKNVSSIYREQTIQNRAFAEEKLNELTMRKKLQELFPDFPAEAKVGSV